MASSALARSVAVYALMMCTLIASAGCAMNARRPLGPIADSLYASGAAYVYQPLNPTTIWVRDPLPCHLEKGDTLADYASPEFKHALLRDLDTETVRISLSRVGRDATAAGSIVGLSVKGESYVLIIDYIKYFASATHVKLAYDEPGSTPGTGRSKTLDTDIPIYAGVGIRIRAEFMALASNLNISGLPGLSAAASANQITGRLTVQTLGITGPDITALMPILSDISVSSIQSAVTAVGAIKAKVYEDSSVAYPKIVGFESPTSSIEAITKITALLYGIDASVVPRVSPNPMKAGEKTLWLQWLPTAEERRCPSAPQALNR